jgi:hypothetical protein
MKIKLPADFAQARIDYLICLIWQSIDEHGETMDQFSIDDFHDADAVSQDVINFIESVPAKDMHAYLNLFDIGQFAHDFCLTRNGHGTGFWDRGLGELGNRLTELSQPWGSSSVYVTCDGKLYTE